MISDCLTVPFKTTTETNWNTPITNLFKQTKVPVKDFETQIEQLQKLRSQLLLPSTPLEKSPATLLLLQMYHDHVESLENKVPSEFLKVEFTWMDAFDKGSFFGGKKYLSLPFLVFERMCVQFNIGALLSYLGAECKIKDSSDEELKTAAKWLQIASGIFAHLSNLVTILPEEALTGDIHPQTMTALSAIMLAQAQEIFVLKAIKGRMKDSLIAKLSVQAEEMFSDALLKMTKEKVKYQFDRNWPNIIAGKEKVYAGLTHYFQSKVAATNKSIGEEIGRLGLALEYLKKGEEKLGREYFAGFSQYVTEGEKRLTVSKKDNDFIYHEVIPKREKLEPVERVPGARLAKPIQVVTPLSPNYQDLFQKLAPIVEGPNGKPMVQIDSSDSPTKSPTTLEQLLPAPLKQALDASLNAVGNYLLRYLEKQQQLPKNQ